ncbi:MAG TPA: TIGR04283 family arsenosugar biosynthesis glycosyltransferase, partial [Nitrospirota bacterium]
DDHDAVVVPAFDGGYCLIGFRVDGYTPSVFRGIVWSTGTVCAETQAILAGEGKSVKTLPTLRDIDTASDIKYLPPSRKFSIIIPVLHEAENINALIKRLHGMKGAGDCEIIIVDGSPDADTLAVIEDGGVLRILSGKGRARQMNAGAAAALGAVLIFLHADTALPECALSKVSQVMKSGQYVGGAFGLLIDSKHPFIKFTSWSAGLRSRFTRIPYGDQAIFIGRDYFHSIGGYNDIPLMEDVELMGRIKKLGGKICILNEPAITSPRKFLKDGPVYSAFRNHTLRIMYSLGVSPEKLEKLYYRD